MSRNAYMKDYMASARRKARREGLCYYCRTRRRPKDTAICRTCLEKAYARRAR